MVSYRRLAMRVLGHVPVLFGKKKASPPPRVAAQRIAALALACAMMTGMALPAFAGTYDIANGSIEIHAKEGSNFISQWIMNEGKKEYYGNFDENYKDPDSEITITGKSTGNTVTIDADKDQTANVTLENVEIDASSTGQAAVDVTGSGNTNIELNGNNTLTGGVAHAGLQHNKETDAEGKETSGKLTITDTDGNGSLCATGTRGGAGIGGGNLKNAGKIEITGGSITATGSQDGAGIGGGGAGGDADITISGGTINAISVTGPGGQPGAIGGAGIGGGVYGSTKVFIEGSPTIESTTGGNNGGAGIGGGAYGDGTVNIDGNATDGKKVTIESAQGRNFGAGIGGGFKGDGNVTIKGNAEIKDATGGDGGAGIGGGAGGLGDVTIKGNATIENAQGGKGGAAGIGGGAETEPDTEDTRNKVSIKSTEAGSPNITAKGGAASDDGQLSGGAAIGSGSVTSEQKKAPAAITIEGKVTIDATAGGKLADKDAIAIGDTPLQEQKFAGLLVGAVIKRWDSAGVDLTLEGDQPKPNPGNPDTEKPGTDKPGTDKPDTDKPGTDKPDTDKPDTDKPDTDKPGTDKPDTDKPDTNKPGTDKPDTDKPDTNKPGTDKPDTDKPDTDKPDTNKPGTGNPDTNKPDTGNPDTNKPDTGNPDTNKPGTENPDTNKPGTENPDTNKPDTENPDTDKPDTDKPDADKPDTDKPDTDKPDTDKPDTDKPGADKPDTDKPGADKPDTDKPDTDNPNPEQPSEPSGAVSTSAPAEELTASDAEYLVTVEGLSVTNALGKQITHSCTQNVQGKVLTIRVNSIVATAHLTMETLRTLKAQGVETIRFNTLLYRPTSVSIDALLNLGVDEADILWTHNGIQARLTVGGTDSSSLLQ